MSFQNLLEFSLNTYYFSQRTKTVHVLNFNNFLNSERIQTKFRFIIQNHIPRGITTISTYFLQPGGWVAH